MLKRNKQALFLVMILLPLHSLFAQANDSIHIRQRKSRPPRPAVRNGVWFEPTRAKEINGLVFGSFSSSSFYKNDSLHVNGIEISAEPITVYIFPYFVIGEIKSLFTYKDSAAEFVFRIPDDTTSSRTNRFANGLYLGLLGSFDVSRYNGVNLSSILSSGRKLNGLSVTIGQNIFYNYHGVLIAGLMNKTATGKGVQVALVNRCKDCRGVQIGLLNTMGRRTLPFINARF